MQQKAESKTASQEQAQSVLSSSMEIVNRNTGARRVLNGERQSFDYQLLCLGLTIYVVDLLHPFLQLEKISSERRAQVGALNAFLNLGKTISRALLSMDEKKRKMGNGGTAFAAARDNYTEQCELFQEKLRDLLPTDKGQSSCGNQHQLPGGDGRRGSQADQY